MRKSSLTFSILSVEKSKTNVPPIGLFCALNNTGKCVARQMSFQYELHTCIHSDGTEIIALCRAFCCFWLLQFDKLDFRRNSHQGACKAMTFHQYLASLNKTLDRQNINKQLYLSRTIWYDWAYAWCTGSSLPCALEIDHESSLILSGLLV